MPWLCKQEEEKRCTVLPQRMHRHIELLQRRKDMLCCCMLGEEDVIGRNRPACSGRYVGASTMMAAP